MFKNPFRIPTHVEYAEVSLEQAKMTLLKAQEQLEYYESIVAFKRKQIARLEGATNNAKTSKNSTNGSFPGTNDSDLRNSPALLGTI
jgi:hypothetical protein